ncbi:hypothetical protein ACFFQW_17965 [Umezawaea endophytica]|uniref:Guanylate cyclase domain-containing protein n=1 Tax=Umezawaea endophytica TaxID=1654476 RepID=A0A9X3AFC2_9PSEU|nr:hypothetical protein [Umezawaea endophytica]MCS7478577.1 hypothetical protein [Umezawaea endophytica]
MPSSEPLDLPPYRAVLVVDTKDFGSNDDVVQTVMAESIYDILTRAFGRAGLAHVVEAPLFPHLTGDGVGMGFDTRYLPAVVSRFFDALQQELAEQDSRMRVFRRTASLRMRASLNVGPVSDPGPDGRSAVVGSTVITAHRMLDTAPVRAALSGSDPEQTFVSAVLSQRVFEDVLVSGYATLSPSRVAPVPVSVKEFSGTVYLYVPKPSGDLLRDGFGSGYQAVVDAVTPEPAPPPLGHVTTNTFSGTSNAPVVQVGTLHGGLNQGR